MRDTLHFARIYVKATQLSALPWPDQDCQNDRPNNTPADPRDVRVSRLRFQDFLVNHRHVLTLLSLVWERAYSALFFPVIIAHTRFSRCAMLAAATPRT
jgi:hypothetical protein